MCDCFIVLFLCCPVVVVLQHLLDAAWVGGTGRVRILRVGRSNPITTAAGAGSGSGAAKTPSSSASSNGGAAGGGGGGNSGTRGHGGCGDSDTGSGRGKSSGGSGGGDDYGDGGNDLLCNICKRFRARDPINLASHKETCQGGGRGRRVQSGNVAGGAADGGATGSKGGNIRGPHGSIYEKWLELLRRGWTDLNDPKDPICKLLGERHLYLSPSSLALWTVANYRKGILRSGRDYFTEPGGAVRYAERMGLLGGGGGGGGSGSGVGMGGSSSSSGGRGSVIGTGVTTIDITKDKDGNDESSDEDDLRSISSGGTVILPPPINSSRASLPNQLSRPYKPLSNTPPSLELCMRLHNIPTHELAFYQLWEHTRVDGSKYWEWALHGPGQSPPCKLQQCLRKRSGVDGKGPSIDVAPEACEYWFGPTRTPEGQRLLWVTLSPRK